MKASFKLSDSDGEKIQETLWTLQEWASEKHFLIINTRKHRMGPQVSEENLPTLGSLPKMHFLGETFFPWCLWQVPC